MYLNNTRTRALFPVYKLILICEVNVDIPNLTDVW